jgi:Cysteine-rich CWC
MHEKKRCACCENIFECKAGAISQCQCNAVALGPEERKCIEDRFPDCLCIDCLLLFKNEYKELRENLFFNKLVVAI